MPRSSIVLSVDPVDAEAITNAVEAVLTPAELESVSVELRPLDDGAVLQVVLDGTVVLSLLRPRPAPAPAELQRILPGTTAPAHARWWSEAYTPWTPEGRVGLALLDAVVAEGKGLSKHQDL